VHAHTGVKTHRIGPGRGRMVARCRVGVPSHASAACERRRGAAGRVERRAWRMEGREAQSLVGKEVASSMPIPQLGVGQYRYNIHPLYIL